MKMKGKIGSLKTLGSVLFLSVYSLVYGIEDLINKNKHR